MTWHDPPDPSALTSLWEATWPASPPIPHLVREAHGDRWVRFHSLPQAKRYASDEAEHATVRHRHETVLTSLAQGQRLLMFTTDWTESPEPSPSPPSWPGYPATAPPPRHWRALPPQEDLTGSTTHLYVAAWPCSFDLLGGLLRAVADDQLSGVLIAPPDLRWLYLPYDGGADVITVTTAERDQLRARHRDWLSHRPDGL